MQTFSATRPLFQRLVPVLLAISAVTCSAAGPTDEVLRQTYPVSPGGQLIIDADQGSLTVTGADTTTATIEVTRKVKRASGEKAEKLLQDHVVRFSQDGATIRVESKVDRPLIPRWTWGGPGLDIDIKVTVPRKFDVQATTAGGSVRAGELEGKLTLKTSGGSLQLDQLKGTIKAGTAGGSIKGSHLTGKVEVSTSGGSIHLDAVAGESLKAHTSGGSIQLGDISVPTDAHTSGGSISIESSATPLNANTSGGSITANLTKPPKADTILKTSAGGITVTLPADSAVQLDASTTAGSVKSDLPVPVTSSSAGIRGSLKGPVNGGGPLLKLRTSAGSIRVKKA